VNWGLGVWQQTRSTTLIRTIRHPASQPPTGLLVCILQKPLLHGEGAALRYQSPRSRSVDTTRQRYRLTAPGCLANQTPKTCFKTTAPAPVLSAPFFPPPLHQSLWPASFRERAAARVPPAPYTHLTHTHCQPPPPPISAPHLRVQHRAATKVVCKQGRVECGRHEHHLQWVGCSPPHSHQVTQQGDEEVACTREGRGERHAWQG
jgi:hypothetical protein